MNFIMQQKQMKEAARKAAIFSGDYKFIWLKLINTRYIKLTGIYYVHSTPYIDELHGGITRYNLEVKGGEIIFEYDPSKNAFVYPMLDNEHNRSFLASHYHMNIWKIEDGRIDRAIAAMAKKIKNNIRKKNIDDNDVIKAEDDSDIDMETNELADETNSSIVTVKKE